MTYLISFLVTVVAMLIYIAVAWAISVTVDLMQRLPLRIKSVKAWYYRRKNEICWTILLMCIATILFFGTMALHNRMFGKMFP